MAYTKLRALPLPAPDQPERSVSPYPWGRMWVRTDGTLDYDAELVSEDEARAFFESYRADAARRRYLDA